VVSLPKGGGAIRSVGEKLAANPVNGSGRMLVPLALSPGRADFGPQLELSYDFGSGNGPFGFGWSLALPTIVRKTDKGLPGYRDGEESDVFVLSGAEDLVPVLDATGEPVEDTTTAPGRRFHRYRPRTEGLFARIERWTKLGDPSDVHRRSLSRDNVLTDHEPPDRSWRGRSPGTPLAGVGPFACDQPTMPGEQRRWSHHERLTPPAAGDQPRQCRGPQPVARLVADPANLAPQQRVLASTEGRKPTPLGTGLGAHVSARGPSGRFGPLWAGCPQLRRSSRP